MVISLFQVKKALAICAIATRLLALELYRGDNVSLGRAAELNQMPVEQFMEFLAQGNVPLYFGANEPDEDPEDLGTAQLGTVVSNSSPLIAIARVGQLKLLASF
jgi:hypothetical protein